MKFVAEGDVYLKPGEMAWAEAGVRIRTVLGSCVAICFWHPERRSGGMAHVMLPGRASPAPQLDGRYADEAMAIMVKQMRRHGAPQEYIAKIFGGASLLAGLYGRSASVDVGARNIERSRQLLEEHGLMLQSSDLGGQVYRRLHFELSTGDVWLKRLPLHVPTGAQR
ncbi:MAG: chemotaxis protein CheD [Leptospirales bacterium]|nr:chemotaxis protein CheD [Leptospirales bacterium]